MTTKEQRSHARKYPRATRVIALTWPYSLLPLPCVVQSDTTAYPMSIDDLCSSAVLVVEPAYTVYYLLFNCHHRPKYTNTSTTVRVRGTRTSWITGPFFAHAGFKAKQTSRKPVLSHVSHIPKRKTCTSVRNENLGTVKVQNTKCTIICQDSNLLLTGPPPRTNQHPIRHSVRFIP